MRTFLIFLFVAVVSLIVYNPQMDDFKNYLEDIAEEEALDKQTSIINQMFTQDTINPRMTKPLSTTERNNYFVFSTYKISITEEGHLLPSHESSYIGIANMFFELDNEEAEEPTSILP